MKHRTLTALGLATLLLTGCASTPEKSPPAQPAPPSVATGPELEMGEVTTVTATVQAVDLENRLVTLKGERGQLATLNVGEDARNLDQVQVGDRVVMKYREAMAIQLIKNPTSGGVTERKETQSGTRAPLGQKPSATLRDKVEVVANVIAVNRKTRKVTLRGPEKTVTVKAPQEVNLKELQVGDQVQVTYVEEFGIAVEPAAKKRAKKK